MEVLTLTVSLSSLIQQGCNSDSKLCGKAFKFQIGIFYFAFYLYVLVVGTGGTKPNIFTLGAYQYDEIDSKEKLQKASFIWWIFSAFLGMMFANSFLIYISRTIWDSLGAMKFPRCD